MKKFWKNANVRLKMGIIITAIFFIIGFVVYFIPHEDPFLFNTYPPKLGMSAEHWLGTTGMGQERPLASTITHPPFRGDGAH